MFYINVKMEHPSYIINHYIRGRLVLKSIYISTSLRKTKAVPCGWQGTAFSMDAARKRQLISPSASNNEALAAALQNKPAPAPEASFHWPYAQRGNPSAPSDRCTQTSRRHSTIYNTPH